MTKKFIDPEKIRKDRSSFLRALRFGGLFSLILFLFFVVAESARHGPFTLSIVLSVAGLAILAGLAWTVLMWVFFGPVDGNKQGRQQRK